MAGVVFSKEEKIEMFLDFVDFGVKYIDLMPSVSVEEQSLVKDLINAGFAENIVASTMSRKEHVDLALKLGIENIALFNSLSDIHLQSKLRISREENIARSSGIIDYAASHGLKIFFAGEDTSRADLNYVLEFVKEIENKIECFFPCDTVGILTPFDSFNLIAEIKKNIKTKIGLHCHNDFGLAVANSLAGIEAGAEIFSGTFTGIGERAGNAPIEEMVLVLKFLKNYSDDFRTEKISSICRKVQKFSGIKVQNHKPIIGKNVFRHESGIHVDGQLKNRLNYSPFLAEEIGLKEELVLGKHSGTSLLKKISAEQEIQADLIKALADVKSLSAIKKRAITKAELKEILIKNKRVE